MEIVEELCSNSATFEAKTEFSQDKYKRKKAKKYVVYIVARQPTARAICQVRSGVPLCQALYDC